MYRGGSPRRWPTSHTNLGVVGQPYFTRVETAKSFRDLRDSSVATKPKLGMEFKIRFTKMRNKQFHSVI